MATKTRATILLLTTLAFLLPASAGWAQESSVSAIDNEFEPAQVDVEAGTTVTWTNDGESPHTVTASDGSFESGNLNPGQSFSYTFDQAGDFSYVCDYHESAGMVGSVTVAEAEDDGGGNNTGDGTTDDPTDPATTDPADDTLPETGPNGLGAFLYVALVFIGVGSVCLWLDRQSYRPQTGSATQSRVR